MAETTIQDKPTTAALARVGMRIEIDGMEGNIVWMDRDVVVYRCDDGHTCAGNWDRVSLADVRPAPEEMASGNPISLDDVADAFLEAKPAKRAIAAGWEEVLADMAEGRGKLSRTLPIDRKPALADVGMVVALEGADNAQIVALLPDAAVVRDEHGESHLVSYGEMWLSYVEPARTATTPAAETFEAAPMGNPWLIAARMATRLAEYLSRFECEGAPPHLDEVLVDRMNHAADKMRADLFAAAGAYDFYLIDPTTPRPATAAVTPPAAPAPDLRGRRYYPELRTWHYKADGAEYVLVDDSDGRTIARIIPAADLDSDGRERVALIAGYAPGLWQQLRAVTAWLAPAGICREAHEPAGDVEKAVQILYEAASCRQPFASPVVDEDQENMLREHMEKTLEVAHA